MFTSRVHEGVLLSSLSLTHVQFNPNDTIAYFLAYITLAPIAILVFYASVIVSRREVTGILMLTGQLLNEVVNAILKEYYQMTRPNGHLGTGYGMPSSHAQFIWYFATYGILYLYTHMTLEHGAWKSVATLAIFTLALLVSFSRIYLGYHTVYQVQVGAGIGTIFGILWHCIVEYGLRGSGCIDYILDHPLAQWLYLRDMRCIDNVAKWEYMQWKIMRQQQSQSRSQSSNRNTAKSE